MTVKSMYSGTGYVTDKLIRDRHSFHKAHGIHDTNCCDICRKKTHSWFNVDGHGIKTEDELLAFACNDCLSRISLSVT